MYLCISSQACAIALANDKISQVVIVQAIQNPYNVFIIWKKLV